MQLELREISKTFGPLKANDAISYTFEGGKTYAILGENGAGKSTLMKIIAGYQEPDPGGQILMDGQAITIHSPSDAIQQRIGMLYQDPLDFPPMTVLENYMTARPNSPFLPDWKSRRAEFLRLSARFGFRVEPDALIESLTIGERQQIEIVRLLSLNVRVLILDEPTTGISEEQRQQLFATLRQLAREDGLIVIIVTHKLADVEALCDSVMVLRHGRVVGTPQMPTPTAELVRLMFGQPPTPDPKPQVPIGNPILTVQGLTVYTRLLNIPDITLRVRAGEVIGLAGLDGMGQNAFMRACAGLNRVSWHDHLMSIIAFAFLFLIFNATLGYSRTVFSITMLILFATALGPFSLALARYMRDRQHQSIFYRGQPVYWRSYRDLRKMGLAYLSAGRLEEGLIFGLTLTQHFALVKNPRLWINWLKSRGQTERAIKTYDIRGTAFSPIQTLSGGNQQRVALALLPQDLRLAFLENPTRGLDVNSARHIWHLLLERRENGAAIVFSSPDLDEIVEYSDRVVVFAGGKWTLVDDPAQINTQALGLLIGGGGTHA